MGTGKVHRAAVELARLLDEAGIPYAIAGAMALGAHGYERATVDVDVLLTRDGLERFKGLHLGRGYVEKFPGSKGLRDVRNGVTIDVLIAGEYPGDGRPKPIAFPDPASPTAVVVGRFRVLGLSTLLELKLASGMTAPHRLRDLADVLELIRLGGLSEALGAQLHPFVHEKYAELWRAAQGQDPE